MRRTPLLLLPLLLASGATLGAQSPHFGFSLNLISPTGDFSSKTYPAYFSPSAGYVIAPQKETYDVGLGGSFTVSFPMDRNLAIRLNLSGSGENGTNRAAGEATINLRHSQFNVGGDLQIFPQGTAFRHRGLYLLAGLSADFEQFDRSFGDPLYDYTDTTRKSRMGGTIGVGHSFGYDAGMRFTLEASYHKTLTGHDVDAGDPPSTDFLKVGFGFVF
ncbi:outer membrane beta-barrel protein [Geothrix sp. 21YS21S-4]|uniref:outer membrane beta-barrel protein n=1 Tax=Geothrix sp. 21YS21S-4 TaxID=3068889 RepID=UPI0027B8DA8F|nr:outer membrane beta-barrel protein [Geothrix sp. 21YS21S-4]